MPAFPVTLRLKRAFLATSFLPFILLASLSIAPVAVASVGGNIMDAGGESRMAGAHPPMQQVAAQGGEDADDSDEVDESVPGTVNNEDVGDDDVDAGADRTVEKSADKTADRAALKEPGKPADDDKTSADKPADKKEPDKAEADRPAPEKTRTNKPGTNNDAAADDGAADKDAVQDIAKPSPGTLHQKFSQIEPIGILTEGPDGGLGEDVWIGSSRDKITALIPQAPRVTHYPIIQDLLRRLYLTEAKPEYLSGSHNPEPGQDLLTLRLQKLEAMGLFGDATKLYSQITDVPYHERLARAGVLSMMEGGKGSLGCLETRTVMDRFGELEFWQTLNAVCDLSLAHMRPEGHKPGESPEANDIDLSGSDSKVIERLASIHGFSYRVSSQKDIDALSPLERAALQANNSFVFEGFHFDTKAPVSPATFGIMIGNHNLSDDMKFVMLIKAASHGLRPISDIQEKYDLNMNDANKKPVGWVRLTKLYAQASTADPGMGRIPPTIEALKLSQSYGGPYAAAPFAAVLAGANPSAFSADQVQDIVRIIIIGGQKVSSGWMSRLAEQVSNKNTLLLFMAAELNSDLSTESKYKQPSLKTLFAALPEREKALAAAVYEKLDKANKLHNYAGLDVYEKLIGLTQSVDYGMPVSNLTSDLTQAYKDKKLGESILLSAIALQGMQPGSLSPGLLQEVVGGMRTVGLTKEARALATEAILSLSN